MGMRSNFKNSHTRDIKDQLNDWYPTLNFDIVLKCWSNMNNGLEYDHCGTHTDHLKACIESHKFRTLMHECREQAESLWQSGQNSISVMHLRSGEAPVSGGVLRIAVCLLAVRP